MSLASRSLLFLVFLTFAPIVLRSNGCYAKTHLLLSEGFSQTQITGAAQTSQSSLLNLGLSIEHFSSLNLGQEISIRTTYLTNEGLVSSMAVGFGLNWYFTEIGRANAVGDGARELSQSELLSACLVIRVEAGRQLLRTFSSLGELEASSEFIGLQSGLKAFFNFSPKWAPGVYLLAGYDKGFGRFPFASIRLQAGAVISFQL